MVRVGRTSAHTSAYLSSTLAFTTLAGTNIHASTVPIVTGVLVYIIPPSPRVGTLFAGVATFAYERRKMGGSIYRQVTGVIYRSDHAYKPLNYKGFLHIALMHEVHPVITKGYMVPKGPLK